MLIASEAVLPKNCTSGSTRSSDMVSVDFEPVLQRTWRDTGFCLKLGHHIQ